jgi:hypothetical protein
MSLDNLRNESSLKEDRDTEILNELKQTNRYLYAIALILNEMADTHLFIDEELKDL